MIVNWKLLHLTQTIDIRLLIFIANQIMIFRVLHFYVAQSHSRLVSIFLTRFATACVSRHRRNVDHEYE